MSKEIIEEEDDISEFEVISAKEYQEGYRMKNCDAPKPGGPLTTRQPAEYS